MTVGLGMMKSTMRRKVRNEPWFLRPDVCIWANVFSWYITSWKILLGGKTYLERGYYNLKKTINRDVANFPPRLYFRSFLDNMRTHFVDSVGGTPLTDPQSTTCHRGKMNIKNQVYKTVNFFQNSLSISKSIHLLPITWNMTTTVSWSLTV